MQLLDSLANVAAVVAENWLSSPAWKASARWGVGRHRPMIGVCSRCADEAPLPPAKRPGYSNAQVRTPFETVLAGRCWPRLTVRTCMTRC